MTLKGKLPWVKRIQLRLVDIAIVSKRNNPVRQAIIGKGFRNVSVSGGHSPSVELVDGRYEEQNHF